MDNKNNNSEKIIIELSNLFDDAELPEGDIKNSIIKIKELGKDKKQG